MRPDALRKVLGLLVMFLILAPGLLQAQSLDNSPAAQTFRKKVDSLFTQRCSKGARAGVKIVSLISGKTLFEKNSSQLFVPASNMKTVTTAAALRKLGPNFQFSTKVYTTGEQVGNAIKGDLYLKGFGDPFLVTERMWLLVNEIKNLPLDKIEGDLVVDGSYFGGGLRVASWKGFKGPEAYLAPLSALSFNFNTIAVHIAPGKRAGEPPVVVIDPATPYTRLVVSAVTRKRGRRGRLIVNRHHQGGQDVITVKGFLPHKIGRKTYYLNITHPLEYTGAVFKKMLGQAGVEVTGSVKLGTVPEGALELHEHKSLPFSDILQGLNKYSNNFIAEQIIRTLAAREYGAPGTTEQGVKIVQNYLKSLGFQENSFAIVDGSGLSRQNRLSPDQIIAVIKDVYGDWSVFPEFVSAMAIMGLDGTVADRMVRVDGAHKIRTKTGTLDHVSSLSGYFQSKDGEAFAFSILMNGLKCSNGRAHRLQNAIMKEALEFSREESSVPKVSEKNLKATK